MPMTRGGGAGKGAHAGLLPALFRRVAGDVGERLASAYPAELDERVAAYARRPREKRDPRVTR